MAEYTIEPDRRTLHGHFSREMPPVLTIESGDRVRFRTLDAGWGIEPERKFEPRDEELDKGHALCGPVEIKRARPGMTLEVQIGEIVPALHGWTVAGKWSSPVNDRMGVGLTQEGILLEWTLDREAATWRDQFGHTVPARPFMGVMGCRLTSLGCSRRRHHASQGAILTARSWSRGAPSIYQLRSREHFSRWGMGMACRDGEVSGTAVECPMDRVVLTFHLHEDMRIETPRADTPAGWITFGFSPDLNEACMVALDAMLTLMEEKHGIKRPMSLGLASLLVDMRITQVANQVWGVHAVLPHGAI